MAESECYIREGNSAFLAHQEYRDRVTADWFFPDYWGERAHAVGSGGRGSAWFVEAGTSPLVLRHYRRGGFVARLSESAYVYVGETSVRSFCEFRLLNNLMAMGLPVPKPVAAWYRKNSPMDYQAAIIVERIVDTAPLADLVGSLTTGDWASLGATLRRFHDASVWHADLNCYNILVRDHEFFLIDFDKGRLREGDRGGQPKWKAANLNRLYRSLTRLAWNPPAPSLDTCWPALLEGYNGSVR